MNLDANSVIVESPCVRNCCLRDDDVCLGCFRHIEEIKAWSSLNNNEKIEVLKLCQWRKLNEN